MLRRFTHTYGYIQQTLDTNTTAETLAVVWMFFCFKAMVNDYHSLPWKTCALLGNRNALK